MNPRQKTFSPFPLVPLVGLLALFGVAPVARASEATYFVAVDSSELITSGEYQGLPNPNHGRLTFLFGHADADNPSANHFHGIGAYSYSGPVENPTVISTNSNNRIPEMFSEEPPLPLERGTGCYSFRLISKPNDSEYSNLQINSIQALSDYRSDSPRGYLFESSNGRWMAPLTGAMIALQLVDITDGLHISNEYGEIILRHVGETYLLGDGNTFTFKPTVWTGRWVASGTYSAMFRLLDLNFSGTSLPASGTFSLDFSVSDSHEKVSWKE
jgi:hypothetical protein